MLEGVKPTDTQTFDPGGDGVSTVPWPNEPKPPDAVTCPRVMPVPVYAIRDKQKKIRHGLFEARKTIAKVKATLGSSLVSMQIPLCVDTCAGTFGGILSVKLVDRLPPELRAGYRPGSAWSQQTLLEAYDGHGRASPDGHIELATTVGGRTETIRYLVCSSMAEEDAILGTGGIRKMGLVVDLPNSRLLIDGQKSVPLIEEESVFLLSKRRTPDVDACLNDEVVLP